MITAGLNDKVPRNYFTPFLKIVRTAVTGNGDSKRLESIYAKSIVIDVIVRICLIPGKLKMTILMTAYRIERTEE